jgi:hypothetical protein
MNLIKLMLKIKIKIILLIKVKKSSSLHNSNKKITLIILISTYLIIKLSIPSLKYYPFLNPIKLSVPTLCLIIICSIEISRLGYNHSEKEKIFSKNKKSKYSPTISMNSKESLIEPCLLDSPYRKPYNKKLKISKM